MADIKEQEEELVSLDCTRVDRSVENRACRTSFGPNDEYRVESMFLAAYGKAILTTIKWPAFQTKYNEPFHLVPAHHPRYMLRLQAGYFSRVAIEGRRLRLYKMRGFKAHI